MTVCKPVQSPLKLHSHEYRIAFQHGGLSLRIKGGLRATHGSKLGVKQCGTKPVQCSQRALRCGSSGILAVRLV